MKRIIYCCIAIVIILLVASEGFIQYALRPRLEDRPTPKWVDSVMACKALRDTFLISKDSGDSIHAWYLRADSATNKVAVLVHGYTERGLTMGDYAEIYDRQLHYNILMPDLHYHGLSKGDYVQMGWRDRLDILQWCEFAHRFFCCHQPPTNQKGLCSIVLHGVSMGAATVMCVSGEKLPPYIKCFVEDCGYTSTWDEFRNELYNQFSLPPFPILYTTNWLNKLQNGWSFTEASPLNQVSKCHKPMLFIHGGNDTFVKTSMVYQLYAAKPAPKQLCVFHGSKHTMSYKDYKKQYTHLVCSFVNKYNR